MIATGKLTAAFPLATECSRLSMNGKNIRVTFPLEVRNEATTTADALTAEKAVEHAKNAVDEGELV